MSSLQKFHRRTQSVGPSLWPASAIGMGDNTHGYWLGTAGDGISKLIVAPKSTEGLFNWGSYGTSRGTVSTTNGVANTNTLVSFGTTAHPAAGACKYLTTGGYNTWYLPAKNELITCYSNKLQTPFSTANAFVVGDYTLSSTEASAASPFSMNFGNGTQKTSEFKFAARPIRAVRRSTI
jgi:hypothetical protein